jgi:fibronectin type 3 domain-containing protein
MGEVLRIGPGKASLKLYLTYVLTVTLSACSHYSSLKDSGPAAGSATRFPSIFIDESNLPPVGEIMDFDPPSTPQNLRGAVASGAVQLNWNESLGEPKSYKVFRAAGLTGEPLLIATVSAPTLTYSDSSVPVGDTYRYSVLAKDTAGNESAHSTDLVIALVVPSTPSSITLKPPSTTPGKAPSPIISVSGTTIGTRVALYSDTNCTTQIASSIAGASTVDFVPVNALLEGSYSFSARQFDPTTEITSACYSPSSIVYELDLSPPSVPSQLAASPGNGLVVLSWAQSTGTPYRYKIFRAPSGISIYTLVDTIDAGMSSHAVLGLNNGTSYSFVISAIDRAGNESAQSSPISATPAAPITPVATPVPIARAETHEIPAQAKMDLLFIIDNSASMGPYQQKVSQSIASFIDQFSQKDISFHIGVATTMTYKEALNPSQYSPTNSQGPFYAFQANSPSQGKLISRFSNELWLSNSTTNIATKFGGTLNPSTGLYSGGNADVGAFSNNPGVWAGRERLDDSLLEVLKDQNIETGGINHGFLRPDAKLVGILISDEDRSCDSETSSSTDIYCTDEQITQYKTILKDRLDQLVRQRSTSGYLMHFIVNSSTTMPTVRVGTNGTLPYPFTYLGMASHFGSAPIDIKSSFAPTLISLGASLATQAQLSFQLDLVPQDASQITVIIGGATISEGATGYTYNAASNTINIAQAVYDAHRGEEIEIRYTGLAN